jgi:hypothetical protein
MAVNLVLFNFRFMEWDATLFCNALFWMKLCIREQHQNTAHQR